MKEQENKPLSPESQAIQATRDQSIAERYIKAEQQAVEYSHLGNLSDAQRERIIQSSRDRARRHQEMLTNLANNSIRRIEQRRNS
jgi:hypothetical protein